MYIQTNPSKSANENMLRTCVTDMPYANFMNLHLVVWSVHCYPTTVQLIPLVPQFAQAKFIEGQR